MRTLVLTMLSVGLLAPLQAARPVPDNDPAPAEVEAALTARVNQFFQGQVDRKYRQVDRVVHEDSADAFYEQQKPRIHSFELKKIQYFDNHTKAIVTCKVDQDTVAAIGAARFALERVSFWKLDKGEWWWYLGQDHAMASPFGMLTGGIAGGAAPAGVSPQIMAAQMQQIQKVDVDVKDVQKFMDQIRVDKTDISLTGAVTSEAVATLTSDAPGEVTLALDPPSIEGLRVSLDKTTLRQGESAQVRFEYRRPDAEPKEPGLAAVRVGPFGRVFVFRLDLGGPKQTGAPKAAQ